MSPQGFLEVEYQRETIVLTPATNLGEFRCQEVEAAKEWVIQLLQEPEIKNVVIDCHAMDYFGSTALALLITLGQIVSDRNGHLVFCNVSSHALEIFKATNLVNRWRRASSKEKALDLVRPASATKPLTPTCLLEHSAGREGPQKALPRRGPVQRLEEKP